MNKIKISGFHYNLLRKHLFPGDNKEAVAIALCGRSKFKDNHTLLVQDLLLVPYELCERRGDYIKWPTNIINQFLEKAAQKHLAIVKIHCHPGPEVHEYFSRLDNESDNRLFRSINAWIDDDLPHASCIMLPDGRLFGRMFDHNMEIETIHRISVAGRDILIWNYVEGKQGMIDEIQLRNLQAFGKKTIHMLNNMTICVVGCSGTGSPVVEQLKRLGVGTLILVDPDFTDTVNLNRIIGSTLKDAQNKTMKVEVMERGIYEVGMGTEVITYTSHVSTREIVKVIAEGDLLISCVDGAEGRHTLNLISSFYLIPLIDMGVKLNADEERGIKNIFGLVHYIQPCGSSLLSRQQYNIERLRAESIKRTDKNEYERNQYLANVVYFSESIHPVSFQTVQPDQGFFYLGPFHPQKLKAA